MHLSMSKTPHRRYYFDTIQTKNPQVCGFFKSKAVNFFEEEGAPLERLSPQKKFTAELSKPIKFNY